MFQLEAARHRILDSALEFGTIAQRVANKGVTLQTVGLHGEEGLHFTLLAQLGVMACQINATLRGGNVGDWLSHRRQTPRGMAA